MDSPRLSISNRALDHCVTVDGYSVLIPIDILSGLMGYSLRQHQTPHHLEPVVRTAYYCGYERCKYDIFRNIRCSPDRCIVPFPIWQRSWDGAGICGGLRGSDSRTLLYRVFWHLGDRRPYPSCKPLHKIVTFSSTECQRNTSHYSP